MAFPKIEKLILGNEMIRRAYNLAKQAHADQKRKNGEPYFNHVLATAELIAGWGLDEIAVSAALLHDVVEDTGYPLEKIRHEFNDQVAFIINGITKLGTIKYRGVERQVENLRKLILILAQDVRAILIKLSDRLHNMKTLGALPAQKQKRIALETMEIYAPLAYRLGMKQISGQLEDLAFPYIYPQEHRWLISHTKEKYKERSQYLEKIKPVLKETLEKTGIEIISLESRAKRYASLYKKLLRYDMDVDKIYDLVALRVIVKDIADCYAALGVIHNLWPPLPNRIKDYIALPKPNGYQSLHTTVFCADNKITEIQIRTQEMHEKAEIGIAANWLYAQAKGSENYSKKKSPIGDKKELQWVRQLQNWQKEFADPAEFLESLKIDFFRDRIFVITPKGEVFDLPAGATPVDFAYHIHSDVGGTCAGARVSGKIMPLSYELKSGDLVEIITQKNKKPAEAWLAFAKTKLAQNHIRAALKTKGTLLGRKGPREMELKIVIEDRLGLLKDISSVISRSHINITSINSTANARFPILRIKCDIANKDKIDKLLLKLKKIKEVKEIGYQLI